MPKEYTATTTLIVDSKSKDPFTGQLLPSQLFPGYMATQIDVINSSKVARKVVDDLKLADSPGTREQFMEATEGKGDINQWLGDLLLKKLSAEPSRESSMIALSFSGTDPRFAAAIANAFAKAYIETSLDLRLAPAKQTAAWFDQQITQLREKLDEAQQKLTAYQREKGIVESEERTRRRNPSHVRTGRADGGRAIGVVRCQLAHARRQQPAGSDQQSGGARPQGASGARRRQAGRSGQACGRESSRIPAHRRPR